MNLWECQHTGCRMTAHGIGTAHGLRAIGWFFAYGPVILCPAHHPHGVKAAYRQALAIVNADGWRELRSAAPQPLGCELADDCCGRPEACAAVKRHPD